MGIDAITSDVCDGFVAHVTRRFQVDVLRKEGAPLMEAAATVLAIAGVVKRDRFLGHFATTIGSDIFVPRARLKPANAAERFSLMKLLTHETTHADDAKRGGLQAMIDYADDEMRAQKEALAYGAGLELEVAITGVLPPLDAIGSSLHGPQCAYALDLKTRAFARGILEQNAVSIANGVHTSRVAIEMIGWLRAHAPQVLHGGQA